MNNEKINKKKMTKCDKKIKKKNHKKRKNEEGKK